METFGDRIRRLREAKGWSQTDLAAAIGISRAAISQIETGDSKGMKPDNLLAAADALDIDVYDLVYGRTKPAHAKYSTRAISSPASINEPSIHPILDKLASALRTNSISPHDIDSLNALITHMIKPAKRRTDVTASFEIISDGTPHEQKDQKKRG